jgi:hypothetical protein
MIHSMDNFLQLNTSWVEMKKTTIFSLFLLPMMISLITV